MSAPNIVEVRDLRTQFGRMVVHDQLNLDIRQGEILSIVGGSGTGKTVLMRQMLGLETPKRGSITLFGESLSELVRDSEKQKRILRQRTGMLFQHGALFSALTVFDNIAQPLREFHLFNENLIRDLVHLKMQMVDLGLEHASKLPADLSGGMIKRVALARALALDPDLLFLDEPTAGLDPDRSDSFVELIQSLHRQLSLTVVMVTHDLDSLFALSNRVAVLADKKVLINASIPEVLKVDHPFIHGFFLGDRGRRAMAGLPTSCAQGES